MAYLYLPIERPEYLPQPERTTERDRYTPTRGVVIIGDDGVERDEQNRPKSVGGVVTIEFN